jgi:hypothetical protein
MNMASTKTKPSQVETKNLAIAVTALSLVADEVNSFTDPEALKAHLRKQQGRPEADQKREAEAIVATAKRLVRNQA